MESLAQIQNILPQHSVEEHEQVILDEFSKILGEIKTDISYLKKGQEDLVVKVDEIKEKQIQSEAQKSMMKHAGLGFWAIFLILLTAYISVMTR